jgi:hypothetical protein
MSRRELQADRLLAAEAGRQQGAREDARDTKLGECLFKGNAPFCEANGGSAGLSI